MLPERNGEQPKPLNRTSYYVHIFLPWVQFVHLYIAQYACKTQSIFPSTDSDAKISTLQHETIYLRRTCARQQIWITEKKKKTNLIPKKKWKTVLASSTVLLHTVWSYGRVFRWKTCPTAHFLPPFTAGYDLSCHKGKSCFDLVPKIEGRSRMVINLHKKWKAAH